MEACKNLDNMAWMALERKYWKFAGSIITKFGLYEYRDVQWEDIWQNSLKAIARSIKKYEERGNLKSYIGKIVFNECRDTWRRIKRYEDIIKPLDDQTPEPIVDSEPSKILSDSQETNLLKDNIKSLPKEFSSTMLLSTDGFSDEEISKRLKTNINTVRTRKSRARKRLVEIKSNEAEFMAMIRGRKLLKKILPSS
jgi:RNA polymerase sigma factor (sigma-70 family)